MNDDARKAKNAQLAQWLHERAEQKAKVHAVDALPQHERREVLDDAGRKDVSAAPKPLEPLRGNISPIGGPLAGTAQAVEPINWKLWLNMPQVKLWEAVALMRDIDPLSLSPSPHSWMSGKLVFDPQSFKSADARAAFGNALLLAERAANHSGPIFLRTGLARDMDKRTALVALPEVVAFFVGCDWPDIPAPLLAPSAPTTVESKSRREDRRLEACEAAGLIMPASHASRLPDGVGQMAEAEAVSRQTYSADVKAALKRRESARREGKA